MGMMTFVIAFLAIGIVVISILGFGIGIIRFIEYLEENPYGSQKLLGQIIIGVISSHILFLYLRISIWHILLSLSIQYCFYCLLDSHAEIETTDPRFIYGLVGSLINYFLMIRFISIYNTPVGYIFPCFLIVWITPICFFFSMSATEDAPFKKPRRGQPKSYGKKILDFIMSIGKKDVSLKE